MFCPDCGTDNSRNQKYCVRCGSNLVVVDQARSIIQEVAGNNSTEKVNPSTVLKTTGIISVLGFLFILVGTIVLTLATEHQPGPPTGLFFAFVGFTALVLIVRRILRLIEHPQQPAKSFIHQIMQEKKNAIPQAQTRSLSDAGEAPYYSVTEERTRQFERERER